MDTPLILKQQNDSQDEGRYEDGYFVDVFDEDNSRFKVVLVKKDVLLIYDSDDKEGGAAAEFLRVDRQPQEEWVEESKPGDGLSDGEKTEKAKVVVGVRVLRMMDREALDDVFSSYSTRHGRLKNGRRMTGTSVNEDEVATLIKATRKHKEGAVMHFPHMQVLAGETAEIMGPLGLRATDDVAKGLPFVFNFKVHTAEPDDKGQMYLHFELAEVLAAVNEQEGNDEGDRVTPIQKIIVETEAFIGRDQTVVVELPQDCLMRTDWDGKSEMATVLVLVKAEVVEQG